MSTDTLTLITPATSLPRLPASISASAAPIESPPTTTRRFSASSLSSDASATAYQSRQVVSLRSCHFVPWPGSSGTSTAYPLVARNSPQGRIDAGEPVNPCSRSTPTGYGVVVRSECASTDQAAFCGVVGTGTIVAPRNAARRTPCEVVWG